MLQGPVLNLGSPETVLSQGVLTLFKEMLLVDPVYTDRVKRHYKLFRDKVEGLPEEASAPLDLEQADESPMPMDVILDEFSRNRGYFPRLAVEEAVKRREEITPHLLSAISDTTDRAMDQKVRPGLGVQEYAMYLLAQFRETRAYPLIVDLCRLPPKKVDDLLGDTITEGLPSILASVCGGDTSLLKSLVEDSKVNEWVRSAALYAMAILVHEGLLARSELIAYYGDLLHGKLEKEPSHIWDALVSDAVELYAKEWEMDLVSAHEEGLVEPGFMSMKDIVKTFSKAEEVVLAKSKERSHGLILDVVDVMKGWACFRDSEADCLEGGELRFPALASTTFGLPVPAGPVVARNAPCPCGSGKKYKKCCGAADHASGKYQE
jgi:hypothetical protein